MKKIILILLVLALVGGGAWYYYTHTQQPRNIIFKTQVKNSDKRSDYLSQGKRDEDYVETTLKGILYNTPQSVKIIDNSQVNRQNFKDAFNSYISAIKIFDEEWIVENVVSEYQSSVRKQLEYPELVAENKNKPWDQIKIVGYALWGKNGNEYVLVFAKLGDSGELRPYPFAKTADGWKYTNVLANDKNFDIIYHATLTGNYHYQ